MLSQPAKIAAATCVKVCECVKCLSKKKKYSSITKIKDANKSQWMKICEQVVASESNNELDITQK